MSREPDTASRRRARSRGSASGTVSFASPNRRQYFSCAWRRRASPFAVRGEIRPTALFSHSVYGGWEARKGAVARLAALSGATWAYTLQEHVPCQALRHEFGHNIGFGHQIRYQCKDGNLVACNDRAAAEGRSPMGGNGAAGLSSNQLIRMGWLETAEHQRATGSGTFSLKALYGSQKGTRALEISMGNQQSLLLEYRRPSGHLDKNLDGVYAYRVTDGRYRTAVPIGLTTTERNAGIRELKSQWHVEIGGWRQGQREDGAVRVSDAIQAARGGGLVRASKNVHGLA
ncbi:hypothetical protein ABZ691_32400 [Streptomyces sp. NPDC006854]|uniref:hypothetical protein n=1 Tax=unclassified Streptomyces TaxID=2593676 RepID=UPI0033E22395